MAVPSKRLVAYLRAKPGALVDPGEITLGIYGYALADESDRAQVRVLVNRARARLAVGERIRTVRGRGYVFEGA